MDNGISSIPAGTWIWWQRRRTQLSTRLDRRAELIVDGAEGRDLDPGAAAGE